MKKFLYVALMTFVMIGMSACSKDKDLIGTKCYGQISREEFNTTISADVTVEFTSDFTIEDDVMTFVDGDYTFVLNKQK